jgi:murein DD-endopeptidase MepM/ murein hydrolase activator NlpD
MSERPHTRERRAEGPRETSQLLVVGLIVTCSFLSACSHPLSHQVRPTLRPLLPDGDGSRGSPRFSWPVDGEVTSGFGPRNGRFHDGIDIAAPRGTPVFAAADGQVIFSDVLRGYGKVVIVRHTGGYLTLYAHNAVNQVQEGQRVRRGTRVATVGQSGRVTGAHLHFEVRKDNRARDPLRYLPQDRRTVLRDPSSR